MPTHGATEATLVNLSQLARRFTQDQRTVRRRLREAGVQPVKQDGRTLWFDPDDAEAAIKRGSGELLDPAQERARLDRARAAASEFDLAVKRGEYVEGDRLDKLLIGLASRTVGHLAQIPTKIAAELAAESDRHRCAEIVEQALREALEEMIHIAEQWEAEETAAAAAAAAAEPEAT